MNTNQTPTGNNGSLSKRWVVAKRKYGNTKNQLDNETIESYYHSMLHKVKQLLKHDEPTVFEHDYKNDNTKNAFSLHAFISSNVYLYIECDFCYRYQVEFAFHQCKHEPEIRKLLDAYILKGRVKEVALQPDFSTFYANVLAFQPSNSVYTFKR